MLQVGDYEVRIKAYRIKSKYGDKVGSCFPEVGPEMASLQRPVSQCWLAVQPWHQADGLTRAGTALCRGTSC